MFPADKIRSQAIRDAARDERCTLDIVAVCNGRTDTTVLAHLPYKSGIMGSKVTDLSACFACHACHDVIDGRAPWPANEKPHAEWYMRRAQIRTLERLVGKGVIKIKGVTP